MAEPAAAMSLAELVGYFGGGSLGTVIAGLIGYRAWQCSQVPSPVEFGKTFTNYLEETKEFSIGVIAAHQTMQKTADRQTEILQSVAQSLSILIDRDNRK